MTSGSRSFTSSSGVSSANITTRSTASTPARTWARSLSLRIGRPGPLRRRTDASLLIPTMRASAVSLAAKRRSMWPGWSRSNTPFVNATRSFRPALHRFASAHVAIFVAGVRGFRVCSLEPAHRHRVEMEYPLLVHRELDDFVVIAGDGNRPGRPDNGDQLGARREREGVSQRRETAGNLFVGERGGESRFGTHGILELIAAEVSLPEVDREVDPNRQNEQCEETAEPGGPATRYH